MGWKKIDAVHKLHVRLPDKSLQDLDWLASLTHGGNRSRTVRVLIEEAAREALRQGSQGRPRRRRVATL